MKLSLSVATRNRAHAIADSLDSIAASLANAARLDAEIALVDNGSQEQLQELSSNGRPAAHWFSFKHKMAYAVLGAANNIF
jgi:glycosyltransferase involved in cell wall biosynthesis